MDGHTGEEVYKISEIAHEFSAHEVFKAGLPTLLFVWSPRCSLSKVVGPAAIRLATKQRHSINLVMANIEDVPGAAAELGIEATPALLLFENGEEVARRTGAMLEPQIADWIETIL